MAAACSRVVTDQDVDVPPAGRNAGGERPRFRPDIEGLRGVAVAAVLLYHAGVPLFSGGYVGVDVFFVISGYLITGLLLNEVRRTGTVSIARFYGGRAKRLLPSVAVVLVAVAVLAWVVLPPVRRSAAAVEIMAAAGYVVNWLLAARSVDYSAVGDAASPVQHFWSLAVEEQFYLVWPVLLLAVAWWARRRGHGITRPLAAVLGPLAAVSFGYGWYMANTEADPAYFSTATRAWELALGGLVAVAFARPRRLSRWPAALLTVAGGGAIGAGCVLLSDATAFPGTAALLPTLGAAALIVAGLSHAGAWPQKVLTLAPVRHVGRVSYSWYLWHWPLLVFAEAHWGHLSLARGIAVTACSYVPAYLTHRFVEQPLRHRRALVRRPMAALRLGAVCTAAAVVCGLALRVVTPTLALAGPEQVSGAKSATRDPAVQRSARAIRPVPQDAAKDRGRMYEDGCLVAKKDTASPPCVYGDPDAATTVVLFGDSHAMHWFPALNQVARKRHWRLVGLTKSGCPAADARIYARGFKREYHECDTWRDRALRRITRLRPAMIVTSGLATYKVMSGDRPLEGDTAHQALERGYTATLRRLVKTGAAIRVIRDVPHGRDNVPDCVANTPGDLTKCAIPERTAFAYRPVNANAARQVTGARLLDATPQLCPGGVCPAVIGNSLVYRNRGHLTATYARTLDDWFDAHLPDLR